MGPEMKDSGTISINEMKLPKREAEQPILWFALSTRNGQWKKLSFTLAHLGIEYYIPASYNTLLFLRSQKERALSLVNSGEIKGRFLIDHSTRTLLIVPDKQMEDFIRVLDLSPEAECLTDATLVKGDRVKVVKGPLGGVEGEIVEAEEGNFLVVRVMSLLCAKVKIPRNYVVPL